MRTIDPSVASRNSTRVDTPIVPAQVFPSPTVSFARELRDLGGELARGGLAPGRDRGERRRLDPREPRLAATGVGPPLAPRASGPGARAGRGSAPSCRPRASPGRARPARRTASGASRASARATGGRTARPRDRPARTRRPVPTTRGRRSPGRSSAARRAPPRPPRRFRRSRRGGGAGRAAPDAPAARGASPGRCRGPEGSEPHVAPVGLRREEPEEPVALLGDLGAVGPRRSSRTVPPTGSTGPGRAPPSTAPLRTRRPAPTPTRPRSIPSARAGRSCCGRRGRAARCRTRAGSGRAPVSRDRGAGRPGRRTARGRARPGTCGAAGGGVRTPRFSPVNPDHDCASATAAGRTRPGTAGSSRPVRWSRSTGRPSQRLDVVKAEAPQRPQMPRGVTWTVREQVRRRTPSDDASRSGHRSAIAAPSCARVRGPSANSSSTIRRSSSTSTPAGRGPERARSESTRSTTGCMSGRRARASSAVTRCSVPRSRVMRTARRSPSGSASLSGRNRSRRDHNAT